MLLNKFDLVFLSGYLESMVIEMNLFIQSMHLKKDDNILCEFSNLRELAMALKFKCDSLNEKMKY